MENNYTKCRLITLVIIMLTILGSCSNIKKENDLTKHNLFGKVKKIEVTSYEAIERFGEIEKGDKTGTSFWGEDYYQIFNIKGNIIELNYYNSNVKHIYKYDNKENLIEIHFIHDDSVLTRKNILVYDDKGNMIVEESMRKVLAVTSFSKDIYKYDKKGNMIENNTYMNDGSLVKKYLYSYDDKGNMIEKSSYNADGNLSWRNNYKYDDKGNIIEEDNFYPSNIIKHHKNTYKYDDKGNMIEDISYNEDGSLYTKNTFKYEFDKKGNWILVIRYINDIPRFLSEREIEYF